jgi:hypothetical protein
MLGVSVRKMKVLNVKLETVTLIGKGRQNLTCLCTKCMKLIVKYFFLADFYFWGLSLIWINTFSLGRRALFGVPFCIRVNTVCLHNREPTTRT